jgi:SRSO17 transposase
MERRFEVRKRELLAECKVEPRVYEGMLNRLADFVIPFGEAMLAPVHREHARTYIAGLLSDLKDKNVEAIAYLHDQDRKNLQHFIGSAPWDHRPLVKELVSQVAKKLGRPNGVLVFDPSAFRKQGKSSVGVVRQWCGRLGKVDNCQVGVYMGYVSAEEHALVDFRLYLPEEWTKDRKRLRKAGVPKEVRFQTRHALVLEMLLEHRAVLPHEWVVGDDELGRVGHFRRDLQGLNERYLLAIPSNTTIRDLSATPPKHTGRGRKPKAPSQQSRAWCETLPETAWMQIDVRDGEKGPLVVEMSRPCPVEAKSDRRWMRYSETLVVFRIRENGVVVKHDYGLSNAPPDTPAAEFARAYCAEHRVEECIKRSKSQAGLASYEVRTWEGWHHHQTLALIGTWFLVSETIRGKKILSGDYGAVDSKRPCRTPSRLLCLSDAPANCPSPTTHQRPQNPSLPLPLQIT